MISISRPRIVVPDGPPPGGLRTLDIVVGDGSVIAEGALIRVDYSGVAWSTGEEFDSSWDRGETFGFRLGSGEVIPGWDAGLVGMRVGGRRRLIVPPDAAYGPEGVPGAIQPSETLVFVVDVRSIG